jgi:hypothetical protein
MIRSDKAATGSELMFRAAEIMFYPILLVYGLVFCVAESRTYFNTAWTDNAVQINYLEAYITRPGEVHMEVESTTR